MAPILIKLVLAPGLVAAARLAERTWGPRAAGAVAAFPVIVGPLLLVTAMAHGAHAAVRAADGTLVGLVALAGFTVGYAETARRRGWGASLAVGWLVAALAAAGAGAWAGAAGAVPAGVIAVLSLAGAGATLIWRSRGRTLPRRPVVPLRSDALAPRAAATALLVTLLSLAVSRLGPTVGGMLAALPIVASMLAVLTHGGSGPGAAIELLRGTISGMLGFVAFCEVVALTIAGAGAVAAFALAAAAALLLQVPLLRSHSYPWARNSAGRSGEASARARFSPSASQSAA